MDPIFKQDDGWYFCDEVWCDSYGPFESEDIARDELSIYCKYYLDGEVAVLEW